MKAEMNMTKEFGDPTEQNRAFDVFEMSNGDLIIGGIRVLCYRRTFLCCKS